MTHAFHGRPAGRHPGWPAKLGPLRVPGGLVALRPVRLRDARIWSEIRLRDELHLAPWEPNAPGRWVDRNARADWWSRCSALRAAGRRGLGLPFAITVDGVLVGQVMVGNVLREPLLSAYVGYWLGAHAVRGGVATAAVAMVVDHCFSEVGLHRIEATVRPENSASLRVLAKLGFREEGMFRRYLEVDGGWRDHLCLALTVEDYPEGLVTRLVQAGRAQPG